MLLYRGLLYIKLEENIFYKSYVLWDLMLCGVTLYWGLTVYFFNSKRYVGLTPKKLG